VGSNGDVATIGDVRLANPMGPWVNEHVIDCRDGGWERYALVIFETLDVKSLLIFDCSTMADVGRALGKRHLGQGDSLQLGQANYLAVAGSPARFADSE